MKNKNIMIVRNDHGVHGGIENQILILSDFLLSDGYNIHFVTNNENSVLASTLREKGVSVHILKLNKIFSSVRDLLKIVKRYDIDIIQSHMFRESIIVRFVKLFIPKIKIIFRVHTYIDASNISKVKKKLYHVLDFSTSFLVNKYISINQFNISELRSKTRIRCKKINHLNNPKKSIGIYSIPDIKKPYEIAMVANFIDMKGHDVLIKAVNHLKQKDIVINVFLLGKEDLDNEVNKQYYINIINMIDEYQLSKQFNFLGYVDTYEYIKNIPVIVLPSYAEGTPNSLLEAMSIGKIVIASEVGGIPELITNKVNGFLHPKGDYTKLAEKITTVLEMNEEHIQELSKNAYITWKNNYDYELIRKDYLNIIDQLIKRETKQ